MIQFGIYDKGGGDFAPKARDAAVNVFGALFVPIFTPTDVAQAAHELRRFTHVICHLRSSVKDERGQLIQPAWETLLEGDLRQIKVIVRVSSHGSSGMRESSREPHRLPNGPWILHLPQPSGTVSSAEWKDILTALKEWDAGALLHPTIRRIFDPRPDVRLALRLLCEAWCLSKGDQEADCGGLLLRGPSSPDDWFNPFGETRPGPEAAQRIADDVGIRTEEVRAFLTQAAQPGLKWPESKDSVDAIARLLRAANADE